MPLYPPPSTGAGDVFGPASSVSNDLAVFGNTTGKLIIDSSVGLANVAQRNIANTFTSAQTFNGGIVPDIILTSDGNIRRNTSDGTDNGFINITGGGDSSSNRGATIQLNGNEESTQPGILNLIAGGTGNINFITGATSPRGRMHLSGGFSWGDNTDPGNTNLRVVGTVQATGLGTTPLNATNLTSGTVPSVALEYTIGTFTPSLGGASSGGSHTYTTQTGSYIKFKNLVFIAVDLTISAKDPTMSGFTLIGGLPFTIAGAVTSFAPAHISGITMPTGATQWITQGSTGQTFVILYGLGSNFINLTDASLVGSAPVVRFSGVYAVV